ncbi:MAG: acetolactate decarboxylase [Verrucomicrobia bacterium]|nr:acetolactate decarboxylase [Verrucomicrobiota bacterium]
MKKLLLLPLLILCGCATAPKNTLMQVSTIDALLAGVYDGQMTTDELLRHGNLGIGTFDALEGEMIVLDGTVYQALSDGAVRPMPGGTTTPFAAVVNFEADQKEPYFKGVLSKETFQSYIDELEPNQNVFVAVQFDGGFSLMKVRSVPKQEKPYPPLAEVVQHQTVFEYTNVTGTVLGFRCPSFVKGINVPGYHLHFISKDRKTGGHILDFTTIDGTLQLDTCNCFHMVLTDQAEFAAANLSLDRSTQLEKVEK